jgi:hypothetical protein
VYRVRGFKGDDRLYLIRKGMVEEEIPHPRGKEKRARAARKVEEVFSGPDIQLQPGSLTQEKAAEILLVARWFRLREREMARTLAPDRWLAEHALPRSGAPFLPGSTSSFGPSSG